MDRRKGFRPPPVVLLVETAERAQYRIRPVVINQDQLSATVRQLHVRIEETTDQLAIAVRFAAIPDIIVDPCDPAIDGPPCLRIVFPSLFVKRPGALQRREILHPETRIRV